MSILGNLLTNRVGGDRTLIHNLSGRSNTNTYVDVDKALKVSAWYAAHKILGEQYAKAGLKLYKRKTLGGRQEAKDHKLYNTVLRMANTQQNAYVYKQHTLNHRFFNGNSFTYIDNRPDRINLVPLYPPRVEIKQHQDSGEIYYRYHTEIGKYKDYESYEILHWIGSTLDGLVGISTIAYAANQIGIALKSEEYQENLLDNSATPSGALTVPGTKTKAEAEEIKRKLKDEYEGAKNSGKTMFLQGGATYQVLGMSNVDLQYAEHERMLIDHVSRFTGVPKVFLSETSQATWNITTEANRHLLNYAIDPYLVSQEMLLNTKLLTEKEQDKYFFEFDRSDFEKMDQEKRSIWVNNGRNGGWLSRNEARSEFNLPPLPPEMGDEYWRPENMAPADAPYEPKNATKANQDTAQNDQKNDQKQPKTSKNSLKAGFSVVFEDSFSRMVTRCSNTYDRLSKKHSSDALGDALRAYMLEQVESHRQTFKRPVYGLAVSMLPENTEIPPGLVLVLDKFIRDKVDNFSTSLVKVANEQGAIVTAAGEGELLAGELITLIEAYHGKED